MGELVQWPSGGEQALRRRMRGASTADLRKWLSDTEAYLETQEPEPVEADDSIVTLDEIRRREAAVMRSEIARREKRRIR